MAVDQRISAASKIMMLEDSLNTHQRHGSFGIAVRQLVDTVQVMTPKGYGG